MNKRQGPRVPAFFIDVFLRSGYGEKTGTSLGLVGQNQGPKLPYVAFDSFQASDSH
jgi:hypothetical protein